MTIDASTVVRSLLDQHQAVNNIGVVSTSFFVILADIRRRCTSCATLDACAKLI